MTIIYMTYAYGLAQVIEHKTEYVDFSGDHAIFIDENGYSITIDREDIISIEKD